MTHMEPSNGQIDEWALHLVEREAAPATRDKYLRDVRAFQTFIAEQGLGLAKRTVIAYKEALVARYAPASVNSMLAAVNGFLGFIGRDDCRVKRLRVQARASSAAERCLCKADYRSLVRAARERGDERAELVVQTLAATGIRVSELAQITVEAVRTGFADVTNKGKTRRVYIPRELARRLARYARRRGVARGSLFVTRTGAPIDRTRVWRLLKELARAAGVEEALVFPHALRHLFSTAFWRASRDMNALAGLLGHARLETTRVYIGIDGDKIRKTINKLGLVV